SAPLIEMKQRAADVMGGERCLNRLGTQDIRVQGLQCLPRVHVSRHQVMADKFVHQSSTSVDESVAPPSRATRGASGHRIRRAGLRIAAVGEDAHATGAEADGFVSVAVTLQPYDKPTKRVRAEIEPEPVKPFRCHHCIYPTAPTLTRLSKHCTFILCKL